MPTQGQENEGRIMARKREYLTLRLDVLISRIAWESVDGNHHAVSVIKSLIPQGYISDQQIADKIADIRHHLKGESK